MSELISRQKLSETFTKWRDIFDDKEDSRFILMQSVVEEIESQPPADRWIPCSDPRKPINGQEIVVTVDLFGKWTHIATTTYYTEKPKHWWEDEWDGEGFYQSHECGYCRREDVTAWFALEPYKGE